MGCGRGEAAACVEVDQQLTVGYPVPVVALASHASSPVVIVRESGRAPSDLASLPVVVGIDGSPTSEAAIAFAFEAASMRDVALVAVHTWLDRALHLTLEPLEDLEPIEAEERQVLSQRLAGWSEKYPDVQVEQLVTCDRPAAGLLEQAAEAQLVVVGSRGRGEFSGLILGSVGNALVHRSPCPVAIVGSRSADQLAGHRPLG